MLTSTEIAGPASPRSMAAAQQDEHGEGLVDDGRGVGPDMRDHGAEYATGVAALWLQLGPGEDRQRPRFPGEQLARRGSSSAEV